MPLLTRALLTAQQAGIEQFAIVASDTQQVTLRAVMPTITPVNFATMVTGAPPEVHGIAAFTDDFACETLFDVVRAHGGKSAGVGQKGYTGSELLGRSADLWGKAASNTDDEVEALALGFAMARAAPRPAEGPQFLIVPLGSTDDVFHRYGPSSPAGVVHRPSNQPVIRERPIGAVNGGTSTASVVHRPTGCGRTIIRRASLIRGPLRWNPSSHAGLQYPLSQADAGCRGTPGAGPSMSVGRQACQACVTILVEQARDGF
jgi:hypothetical protein